jgi:hypothetical protein
MDKLQLHEQLSTPQYIIPAPTQLKYHTSATRSHSMTVWRQLFTQPFYTKHGCSRLRKSLEFTPSIPEHPLFFTQKNCDPRSDDMPYAPLRLGSFCPTHSHIHYTISRREATGQQHFMPARPSIDFVDVLMLYLFTPSNSNSVHVTSNSRLACNNHIAQERVH